MREGFWLFDEELVGVHAFSEAFLKREIKNAAEFVARLLGGCGHIHL